MKNICDDLGLRQFERAPTRGDYLLALCISDIEGLKVVIEPSISDHHALMICVPTPAEKHLSNY